MTLFVAATEFEILPLQNHLLANGETIAPNVFSIHGRIVALLVTGVGQAHTAYALGRVFATGTYDLVINAGVAGAFSPDFRLGEVVQVVTERFADLGVEERDGHFTDMWELGLIGHNQPPYQLGWLENPAPIDLPNISNVRGLTVNTVHGEAKSIAKIRQKYPADIETMEGAALFFACLTSGVPFAQLRAVSNHVEPRNRDNWQLGLAIENLNKVLISLI